MSGTLILPQPDVSEDPDEVCDVLAEAFTRMKEAVLNKRDIVVVVVDRDLLGHGSVGGAAMATGLLGMVRALALEGAREGWRANVIARAVDEPVEDAVARVGALGSLSGQLLRPGVEHLGRVVP